MKKFNFKRMLLLAVMLMTLTSVIAVSAFAEITGGNGAFVGSDYQNDTFATYTMSGLAMVEGTQTPLTEDNNKDLAGLYMVKENGGTGKIIYVRGKIADRQNLVSASVTTTDNTSGNINWRTPGKMNQPGNTGVDYKSGYTLLYPTSHYGFVSTSAEYKKINFVRNMNASYKDPALFMKWYYDDDDSTDGNGITKELYADACELFSFKYPFKTGEIIPTSEFNSFTYGVARLGTIDIGSTDTKLSVLVYNANSNEFKTYEAIDNVKTAQSKSTAIKGDATSEHTIKADELTSTDGNKLSELGDGNYVVGVEIFPAANVDPNNIQIDDMVYEADFTGYGHGNENYNNFEVTIYYNKYDIKLTVADAPQITYDGTAKVVSGLEASTTKKYYIAPIEMNDNGDGMQAVSADKENLPTNAEGKADLTEQTAGLWGIGINGDDYQPDSNFAIVYIPGTDAEKQNITMNQYETSPTGYTYPKRASSTTPNTDWAPGLWTHFTTRVNAKNTEHYAIGQYDKAWDVALGETTFNMTADQSEDLPTSKTDEPTSLQEKIMEASSLISFKYELLPQEILPAKDFLNFKYGVRLNNSSIIFGTDKTCDTKMVIYSLQSDGKVKTYNATKDHKKPEQAAEFGESIYVYTASDFANLSQDTGYIVGIEIFPCIATDATEIISSGTSANNNFALRIYYNEYKFVASKAPINDGITYDAFTNTISGLLEDTDYYLATYSLDGANTDIDGDDEKYDIPLEDIVDGDWTLPAGAPTGLLAVIVKGNEYTADSDPVYFYTPSSNAGHINCVEKTKMEAENTTVDGYYGKVGKWTYEKNSAVYNGTKAYDGAGGEKPSIYSKQSFAYQIIERYYTKNTYDTLDVYTEGEKYEYGLEDVAFYYAFESDEVFLIQDFDKFSIPGAVFIQGIDSKRNIVCDAGHPEAIQVPGEEIYYREVSGGINEGVSFEPILTLYYLDSEDNTIKSHAVSGGTISTAKVDELNFTSDVSELNGYVVAFSIKPYQNIDSNGHETLFTHNLNFSGQCYWDIAEDADGNPLPDKINSITVGEHVYGDDKPVGIIGNNGSFAVDAEYAENAELYADKFFQAAPLEISSDGSSMETGDYGDVFKLSDAKNSGFSGLWIVRFCNEAGTVGGAPSNIVYFAGTNEQRKELGDINEFSGEPVLSKETTWQTGVWTGKLNYVIDAVKGSSYNISYSAAQVPALIDCAKDSGEVQDKLFRGTDEEKVAAQNTITEQLNVLSHKYAYMSEEIIPAKDFSSFKYKVGIHQGSTRLASDDSNANTNTKVVVYVANADKSITKYEKLINEPSMAIRSNNGLSNEIVVKASDLLNGSDSIKDSDGYVVGIEIFPVQITVPSEIYAKDPGNGRYTFVRFNVEIIYGDYALRVIPDTPRLNVEHARLVDKKAGENIAYATITGLIPSYRYEMLVDEANDTWIDLPYYSNGEYMDGGEGTEDMTLHKSEYSIKVPVDTNDDMTETYIIRVKETDENTLSDSVVLNVYYLDAPEYQFTSLENEEQIINLSSDFIEVQADYTIDIVRKPWTQNVALNNLKLVAPNAFITFQGDGFKFVVRAEDINIDRAVHYYNFNVSMNGSSRHDIYFEQMKELAGENFVAEYMIDSLNALPFTKADLYIYVGEEYNGKTLEIRSYYSEFNKLRKWAESEVADGWVPFNLFDQPYVIYENK